MIIKKQRGVFMKFRKRILPALICAMLSFTAVNPVNVMADNYVVITQGTVSARVIQIIDGDAIKVQLLDTNEIALIKIIGVNSRGYDGSVKYLTDRILGATVTLVKDGNINIVSGNWNYRYVIYNGVNISNELVTKGYAALDTSQSNGTLYSYLSENERGARSTQMELWGSGTNSNNSVVGNGYAVNRGSSGLEGEQININTASAYQLKEGLYGINETVAKNIVKYRSNNPFNEVSEIIFVNGFTKEMYQSNKNNMTVCTNVSKASKEELESLGLTDDEVEDIISYRTKSIIDDITDLKRKDLITDKRYESLKPYISIGDSSSIDKTINGNVANINKATAQQLSAAGLTPATAEKVIDQRTNGYTIKHLMELRFLNGINLTDEELYYLEDNLHARTNINDAKDSELRSIFNGSDISKIKNTGMFNNLSDIADKLGSDVFEDVKAAVYCTRNTTDYVNINTATASQIELTGMSYEKARRLVSARPMKCAEDIPFDISDYDEKITLYTNLNTASQAELKTLNNGITDTLAAEIINYRNQQYFGNYEDVRVFFLSRNAGNVYNAIKDYIVLR